MRKVMTATLLAALVAFAPRAARAQDVSPEDGIRATVAAYQQAWNAGDARALAQLYATSADTLGFSNVVARGRGDIETRYGQAFAGAFAGTSATVGVSAVRAISADVAVVDGTLEISGLHDAEGNAQTANAVYVGIMTREDGAWVFTSFWSKRVQTPAAPQ
jgi:uncharacterized protein (TIGR02246 family)